VKFSDDSGRIDLMLLPEGGKFRLGLVEAKCLKAPDAEAKVIGQLLKYYACAISDLGTEGVERYRAYANEQMCAAHCERPTTPQHVCNGKNVKCLSRGIKLKPEDIALFVAIDGAPSKTLRRIITLLRDKHDLDIGILRVSNGRIKRIRCP
jgi:hypothetical protein